jgi:hypothetical protein
MRRHNRACAVVRGQPLATITAGQVGFESAVGVGVDVLVEAIAANLLADD